MSKSTANPRLLRCRLQSRHAEATKYWVFVEYSTPDPFDGVDDRESVFKKLVSWYCTCKSGARTLGMCGHVAATIYYLGVLQQNLKTTSERKRTLPSYFTDVDYNRESDASE